ncbi:Ser/Thr protein kinase RdoA (MazF antagonist) [Filimonas zeae]|uniref:Aminoglycoside phosphotransferase domain-containing protein n=1 Tax=Filimonas zeae TaxID=1737353 RepID=A0A917J1E3_9BACT|nr:phosphotransferase [Filimonas zeae]MDR6341483.1 Ser/Thr protein kinase RdoA (MazF antagonist) [Filimonas zeae]GGH75653.1 hypothetical protein GCM10011379_39440 [Filimonas zeae]
MKSFFPATYSTLSTDALARLLTEKYGLTGVQCQLLMRGVGDTYSVTCDQARYILRAYRPSHRSLPQVQEEVDLLLALHQAGVSVSYPLKDTTGEAVQLLNAIEGERCAVLFTYAPGQSAIKLSESQLRVFGREMARFHNVSATLAPKGARWNFDLNTLLFHPLETLKAGLAEDTENYRWLADTAERIRQRLAQTDTTAFSKGYCHFDFLPKNFHFDGDTVTFFDFDFMGHGWLVIDIMTFWQHLAVDVYAGRATQQEMDDAYRVFLEGYREYREISEEELAVVPYLAPGFWLFYMSFHTTHDQFYVYTTAAYRKVYIGVVKHLVKTYWGVI